MLRFEVDYTSADKVQNIIRKLDLSDAFGDGSRSILRKVGILYLKETEDRFSKQYDPDRKSWKKLSPTTLRIKKQTGSLMGAEHVGVWTGTLASSLQMRVSGNSVFIGTNVHYAPFFHYGVKRLSKRGNKTHPWNTIPSRRFLGRNTRIDEKVIRLIKQEVGARLGITVNEVNDLL